MAEHSDWHVGVIVDQAMQEKYRSRAHEDEIRDLLMKFFLEFRDWKRDYEKRKRASSAKTG